MDINLITMRISFISLISLIFAINIFSQTPEFIGPIDLGIVNPDVINEASGIIASRKNHNVLWIHNDNGNDPKVYAVNTKGEILAAYILHPPAPNDWEDIAIGPGPVSGKDYIYIGDIGDNFTKYENKYIYRFEEPIVNENQDYSNANIFNFDVITFQYPAKIYDAETLMLDPNTKDLYIITKRLDNEMVYKLEYPYSIKDLEILEFITKLPFGYEGVKGSGAVGGDISADGSEALIKTYSKMYYFKKENNESISDMFSKTPKEINYSMEPQGEALCWHPQSIGYYTISEMGSFRIPAHLYFYQRTSTSVKKKEKSDRLAIKLFGTYPFYKVSFSKNISGAIGINIYNINGILIDSFITNIAGEKYFNLDYSRINLASGVYFMRIIIDNSSLLHKFNI